MKVRCEYCQNMVEAGGDKICPFCGSPLPAPPETPKASPPPAPAPSLGRQVLLTLLLALLAIAIVFLWRFFGSLTSDTPRVRTDISVSDALEAVNSGTADASVYQVVIAYYLEGGKPDTAYQAARDLMELPDCGTYILWSVREFTTFGQPGLAARLAMAQDVRTGSGELYPLVEETPLSDLLPNSPLCQAMELVLGRTAGNITLADLQRVTGLYVGRRDTLTGAQEIGVAFDPEGENLTLVTVEFTGAGSGLGTVCFQGLRQLTLNDTNVRTGEDLLLPNLTALSIPMRMDAENLQKFTHLKQLERLQLGGPALVSLEGLEELTQLKELCLFDTGLTDLSALAAQRRIVRLTLLDNSQLSSVASLSQAGHLESLTLSGSALTDLSPLASLRALEELTVADTAIRDTAFLAGMTGLRSLTLTGNKELGTVPELGLLPGLERLTLDSDEVFDSQEDLETLTNLTALKLRVSKKLSFLQPLSAQLEELTIYSYQAIWDISGLSQFSKLKRLSFSSGSSFYDSYSTTLEGLYALGALPLEELDLSGKKIYGPLDAVLGLSTLRVLNLNDAFSEGTDYSLFANLTNLRDLDLGGYRDMVDTPPGPDEEYWSYQAGPAAVFVDRLGLLTGLERLNLSGCGAEDIGSLSVLTGLKYLDLSDNRITDLSPLAGLTGLEYLRLSGNRIGDYTPVEGRSGLTIIR